MQLSANTEVLKEPRGFIKLIEIILAICAFATAVGPHITASFKCCNNPGQIVQLSMQYPYGVGGSDLTSTVCQCYVSTVTPSTGTSDSNSSDSSVASPSTLSTTTKESVLSTDFLLPAECRSSSEFYVFIGVTAFLFSLAAIIFYVFAQDQYAGIGIIPKADFVITVVFTLFWLFSSAAFAAALSKIKYTADPDWLKSSDNLGIGYCFSDAPGAGCVSDQGGNYSTLNVSVIFGFLNMIVWGGNNWFLYKETNWFGTNSSSSLPPQSVPTSTSEIQPKV